MAHDVVTFAGPIAGRVVAAVWLALWLLTAFQAP